MLTTQFGFVLFTDLGRIEYALIRRLGFVVDFFELTALALGLDQFGQGNEVIEKQAMHFIECIQLCHLRALSLFSRVRKILFL